MSVFTELKRRNVFRVGIAYVVTSWLLLQVADIALDNIAAPSWVMQVFMLALVLGFPLAVLFAWAFELTPEGVKRTGDVDQGESITHVTGRKIDVTIIAVLAIVVILLVGKVWFEDDNATSIATSAADMSIAVQPLVVMMDSHNPIAVYDIETAAAGGTNADVVSDILLDLPIRRQKEAVGPDWHRDQEILGFKPDLIIVHWSGFRQKGATGPRIRLRLLIEFFADSDTRFLVYSRQAEAGLEGAMMELLADLDRQHPGLLERVHVFGLKDYGEPKWLDPTTAASLKLRVKTILALD
jgi:hypothetical protein